MLVVVGIPWDHPQGKMLSLTSVLTWALALGGAASAFEWNTFDGPGYPACHNVSEVHNATSVEDMAALVKQAVAAGKRVRAAGKGHMWYDTQCSDEDTVIIRTEEVSRIYDLDLEGGSVMIEGGVTFFQLAEWLHNRGAVSLKKDDSTPSQDYQLLMFILLSCYPVCQLRLGKLEHLLGWQHCHGRTPVLHQGRRHGWCRRHRAAHHRRQGRHSRRQARATGR